MIGAICFHGREKNFFDKCWDERDNAQILLRLCSLLVIRMLSIDPRSNSSPPFQLGVCVIQSFYIPLAVLKHTMLIF